MQPNSQIIKIVAIMTCLAVWINLICLVEESSAERTLIPLEGEGPFDCWNIAMRAGKVIMKTFGKCSKEVKANATNEKEYSERLGCIMKCTMKRINFISEDDKITNKSLVSFLQKFVPNEYLVSDFSDSITDLCTGEKAILLDAVDTSCKSYSELAACLQTSLGEVVERSKHCTHKPKNNTAKN